jgi:hypothetical protein
VWEQRYVPFHATTRVRYISQDERMMCARGGLPKGSLSAERDKSAGELAHRWPELDRKSTS